MALGALQQITGSDMETLIQAVCRSPDLQGVKTLISTERVEGQRLRVIEPYRTAKKKKQSCSSYTLERAQVQSSQRRDVSVRVPEKNVDHYFALTLDNHLKFI